jgi:hypothetical protein
MGAPRATIKKLQEWLKARFKKDFTDCDNQLEHGLQDDGTSCGILAANTAAHEVFDDPLWMVKRKAAERVGWFVALSEIHMKDVGFQ